MFSIQEVKSTPGAGLGESDLLPQVDISQHSEEEEAQLSEAETFPVKYPWAGQEPSCCGAACASACAPGPVLNSKGAEVTLTVLPSCSSPPELCGLDDLLNISVLLWCHRMRSGRCLLQPSHEFVTNTKQETQSASDNRRVKLGPGH